MSVCPAFPRRGFDPFGDALAPLPLGDDPVVWTHYGPSVGVEICGCERSVGTLRRWVGKTAGPRNG